MTDPTPAEIARVRRWAEMQKPEVRVEQVGWNWKVFNAPAWLDPCPEMMSRNEIWKTMAEYLRPVFASVAPVLFEEAAKVCESIEVVENLKLLSDVADECAAAIRGLS